MQTGVVEINEDVIIGLSVVGRYKATVRQHACNLTHYIAFYVTLQNKLAYYSTTCPDQIRRFIRHTTVLQQWRLSSQHAKQTSRMCGIEKIGDKLAHKSELGAQ